MHEVDLDQDYERESYGSSTRDHPDGDHADGHRSGGDHVGEEIGQGMDLADPERAPGRGSRTIGHTIDIEMAKFDE